MTLVVRHDPQLSTCAPIARRVWGVVCALLVVLSLGVRGASADVELPPPPPEAPIVVQADQANRWQQGAHEVWHLRGRCNIQQGRTHAHSSEAVLWIKRGAAPSGGQQRVIAYLEGNVLVSYAAAQPGGAAESTGTLRDATWLGEFHTTAAVDVRVLNPGPEPTEKPRIYKNGLARRDAGSDPQVRPAQFAAPSTPPAGTLPPPPAAPPAGAAPPQPLPVPGAQGQAAAPVATRRLQIFPRSRVPYQGELTTNPQGTEAVVVIKSGVTLIVDGLPNFGSIDVSTDNLVIWTAGLTQLQGETLQAEELPLELYMEGNIVFRQGNRVIHAERMYYNVREQVGVVLNTEILSPVPNYDGLLRLRAAVVQQTGPGRFNAQQASVTSSRLAVPGYRLQSASVFFEDQQVPVVDPFTGLPQVVPGTAEPLIQHQRQLTSNNNLVFLGNVPVFYWPTITTDLEESSFFVRSARFKNDRIFGTQVFVDLDTYQLLGRKRPPGVDWTLSTDYLSKRGPGLGTAYTYQGADLFGLQGPYRGFVDAWGIIDHGTDTLGSDRMNLPPEPDRQERGRVLARHRQYLPNNFRLSGQLGLISDRNFLEQYFEREWDQNKDYDTELELKQFNSNRSWSILASGRPNSFVTTTQWLPRLDHYWIGQPLLGDRLTWFEHSSAAYADMRAASTPSDPSEAAKFSLLPWERNVAGERFATRHEIDLPLPVGPVKVVPYALGELAHWGEDLNGNDLNRAYAQLGVRASIPFWAANPAYEDLLFNVHGLAHKVVFDVDAAWANSNESLSQLPLYDPIDDDNIEAFNRRFQYNTFGAALGTNPANPPIPQRFDPRFYALRAGLGSWVTSPSTEIADDLTAIRLGARQRWQTKRGLPGARHIIDWITLDTEAVIFPQANRDNFGQAVGLVDYDFRWHVGDRTTLVSDGIFDFFSQGQQLVTVGAFLNRPPRGSLYLGFRSLNGFRQPGTLTPLNSEVLVASYSYRMSPKWVSSAGATVDVANNGNIGEQLAITRIGESFLVSVGMTVDASKDNVGVNFLVEPRFLPRTRLGRVGGAQVPQAGQFGLE